MERRGSGHPSANVPLATPGSSGTTSERELGPSKTPAPGGRLALDLVDLLAGTLERTAEIIGATCAVAFALDARGEAFRAASFGDVAHDVPESATLEQLLALPRATDLEAAGVHSDLLALARERGLRAAVSVARQAHGSEVPRSIAALLFGFSEGEALRPRTLATLDRAVRRLATPLATALAVARLSELDAEVLRMTRLATLGELVTEIVHEVRNPLVSVKTFLQLLPGHLDDPDFHTNFRRIVLDEARRIERLLDSLLHHARPSPSDPLPSASLRATIESVGRLLEKRALAHDQTLVIDVAADLPEAAIAEDSLRQIVLNLGLNALAATPEGRSVKLTAVSRCGEAGQAGLELIIDDEGPGVREEDRDRLFDPFFSTRTDRPVGLGLTVCLRIARAADGAILVETAPSGGARFRVWLPAA